MQVTEKPENGVNRNYLKNALDEYQQKVGVHDFSQLFFVEGARTVFNLVVGANSAVYVIPGVLDNLLDDLMAEMQDYRDEFPEELRSGLSVKEVQKAMQQYPDNAADMFHSDGDLNVVAGMSGSNINHSLRAS